VEAEAPAPAYARADLASEIKDAAAQIHVTSASTSELESVIMRESLEETGGNVVAAKPI
jgi:hypothetical protein